MANVPISKMQVPGSNDVLLLRDDSAANLVTGATNGNLASLDASGNLADSGWKSDKTATAVSGNPISISGLKSNQLAKDPIITFEPIQAGSGDPSPSNERPISGYDKIEVLSLRKNLLSPLKGVQSHDGITVTPNDDGSITLSGSNTKGENIYFYYGCNNLSNSDYIQIYTNIPTDAFAFAIGNEGVWIISERFTNAVYMIGIAIDANANFSTPVTFYPMIRLASITDPTYEPYNPLTDIQLTLGQTIYGGTLDVEKGILTVDSEIVDLSTLSWVGSGQAGGYYCGMEERFIHPSLDIVAEKYTVGTSGNNKININDGNVLLVLTDSSSPTGKAVLKINPYTIQLTPHEISLLKDYAYISTNGTNIQFSYKNGEMASLGDVAQVGETVNELGRELTERIKKTVVSISSTDILPLGYDDTLCPIVAPASGYRVLSFYFKSSGRYGTYLLWGLAPDEGKIVASNTHPSETAKASGDMVIYWVKI